MSQLVCRYVGVEKVVDFTEVVEEDLLEMGLPLLQRRRFKKAATLAEETYLMGKVGLALCTTCFCSQNTNV
jgi:hypothetical protein